MEFLGELLRDYTRQAQEAQYSERRLNEYFKQELTPRLINIAKQGKNRHIITFNNDEFSFEELVLLSKTLHNHGVHASVTGDKCLKGVYHLDMDW